MAGSNKILKPEQVLFRAGDKSDGMYLIRRGELKVFLEQEGNEVALATIGEGGMIGEMAMFDQLPRSASVKATKDSEVSFISMDDFNKLMKQIPKWFVTLMSSLSNRLRQTNERLKKLESTQAAPTAASGGQSKDPAETLNQAVRLLHVFNLIWHKDAEKDASKEWVLRRAVLEKVLIDDLREPKEKVAAMLEGLVNQKVITMRTDVSKNVMISMPSRGTLGLLANFLSKAAKANDPKRPIFNDALLGLILATDKLAQASPYDGAALAMSDLIQEGRKAGKSTSTWDKDAQMLKLLGDEAKLVKTSSGVGIKAAKKEMAVLARHYEAGFALLKSLAN